MAATEPDSAPAPLRPFVFDVADIPGHTNEELMGGQPDADQLFELPRTRSRHEDAGADADAVRLPRDREPGEAVKPHRHGTYQVNYVLRGELLFGNQRVGPGMGYFSPDMLYSWRAGEEGAEWIEIHSGLGGIYTDRPEAGKG